MAERVAEKVFHLSRKVDVSLPLSIKNSLSFTSSGISGSASHIGPSIFAVLVHNVRYKAMLITDV